MLLVTDPADDLQLLSTEELRLAAGLESSDSSQDTALAALGLRAAGALAAACNIARAGYASTISPAITGAAPLTLKLETLSETFRLRSEQRTLYLARRPVGQVVSITASGDTVAEYDLDVIEGALVKLTSDDPCNWPCGKTVVVYEAGYETIPDDLKGFASQLVGMYYTSGDDPNEKRVSIPGVIERERWVDKEADGIVPDDILAALLRAGYRKPAFA